MKVKIKYQCSKKANKCPPIASSLYYAHSAKKASNMSRVRSIARVIMQDEGGLWEWPDVCRVGRI